MPSDDLLRQQDLIGYTTSTSRWQHDDRHAMSEAYGDGLHLRKHARVVLLVAVTEVPHGGGA